MPPNLVDSLGDGKPTRRYDAAGSPEIVRAQAIGADVVMTVRTSTDPAIHEQLVQDGRYSRTGAGNRGTAELAAFGVPHASIQFETEDLHAKPGRVQAYDLGAGMAGQFMIVSAELTWPAWGHPPRRSCVAADVRGADVTDAWLVDTR